MITLDNLTLTYYAHPVVHHISLTIPDGTLTAIIGPNGAGKSSLLNAIAGIKPINEGRISGANIKDISYLPQRYQLNGDFPINVWGLVKTGLFDTLGPLGVLSTKQRHKIKEVIYRVGLSGFERRGLNTLSGGQQQRALFARLILENKTIILLDEPFNAIDQKTSHILINILKEWQAQNRIILVVTHHLDQVKEYFPNALYLARELLAYGKTSEVLTKNNMAKAASLSESFDEHADICHQADLR